ncbi:unnamed protein product [Blepharisma stoltei]|uniref:Uncharacterized protein n=1 Tax=Blepharisma stoltei TaxID=1481888 RepID=A0AAU9IM24_9CILI|nr:unnamed protein product [Blepharisma stoltei]
MAYLHLLALLLIAASATSLCENPCIQDQSNLVCCSDSITTCGEACCPTLSENCAEIAPSPYSLLFQDFLSLDLKSCNKYFLMVETEIRIFLYKISTSQSWDTIKQQLYLVLKYIPYMRAYCFS